MKNLAIVFFVVMLFCTSVAAQTTAFSYQGSLKDGANAANGNYDFEFKLFDLVSSGAQQGSTLPRLNVVVANGIFSVSLDFGAGTLPGADRFLDIGVRTAGGGAFTALSPRQKVNSAPYSVKSLNAAIADTATNATQLGGVAANQYVVTTDPRMTDSRTPLAGSANYIQNSTTQQALSNFNVSGNGTAGGTLRGNIVNATTQYNIGNQRVLSGNSGSGLLFVGQGSGVANTGGFNSFVGINAGASNTDGFGNSFVGSNAGFTNTSGNNNSFFGSFAGLDNDTGFSNSFFGYNAGRHNTSTGNSFFGSDAGTNNTTGGANAFFGNAAGSATTSGGANSFFGALSGISNSTGSENSFFGRSAGFLNSSGSGNSFFGPYAGFNNTTGDFNSMFGLFAGQSNATGAYNSFFGYYAGIANNTGTSNSFFGTGAGIASTSGNGNSFFGHDAGKTNTVGANNTAVGDAADVTANNLSFATTIGSGAVVSSSNTVVLGRNLDTVQVPGNLNVVGNITGTVATASNALNLGGVAANQFVVTTDPRMTDARTPTAGSANYIQNGSSPQASSNFNISGNGTLAGTLTAATVVTGQLSSGSGHRIFGVTDAFNTFVGDNAGVSNAPTGQSNSFIGNTAGYFSTTGDENAFVGTGTGQANTTGSGNTLIGAYAELSVNNLTNAGAIGAHAFVSQNNSLILGSINGINGAAADTNVGIGTTAPAYKLHVVGENVRVEGNTTSIFPRFSHNFTGGVADEKRWQNYASPSGLNFSAVNDAENSETRWLRVNRGTGTAITSVIFENGFLGVNNLGAAGATALCRNASNQISTCSSSLRYKTNIGSFSDGLAFVNKLRPISFDWKDGGMKDIGFGAEDIAKIDPRFVTYNSAGEVEGVKYDRLSVAFVNAFKEQQAQIKKQQSLLEKQQVLIEQLEKRLEQLEKKEQR